MGWFNQAWRRRFLIFAQLLRAQSLAEGCAELEVGEPIAFSTDQSLREDRLIQLSAEDEESDSDINIGIEEMEEWAS
jgi:hypothetical protein